MTHIVFEPLFPDVRPPARGSAASAGYDLAANLRGRRVRVWRAGAMEERDALEQDGGTLILAPGEKALVPLGFRARLPVGYEAQVRPRSGTSIKTDLVIANAPGTIDADYPDEWCVPVKNGGNTPLVVTHGERIAQMVLARFETLEFMPGQVTQTTDRTGGFGSTGTASAVVLALLLGLGGCTSPPLHTSAPVRLPVADGVSFLESDGHRVKVDVYQPEHGRYPAAILLHGSGGIHAIVESQINRYAEALAEQGMAAYVVHYFDGTGDFIANDSVWTANYFHWVREIRETVGWVLKRPEVRGRQVGLVGHSLGAWLAVGVASNDPRINAIVLFGGGLEPFFADSIRRMPPTLIFHGAMDDVVPLRDATNLEEFLRAHKYRVEMHVFPEESHVFSDSSASLALSRAAHFLAPNARRVSKPDSAR